jgi:hypothetical protein
MVPLISIWLGLLVVRVFSFSLVRFDSCQPTSCKGKRMCNLCKEKSGQPYCEPCKLTLERFDASYRTGVQLNTLQGMQNLVRERI